jgi:hypothetical protein
MGPSPAPGSPTIAAALPVDPPAAFVVGPLMPSDRTAAPSIANLAGVPGPVLTLEFLNVPRPKLPSVNGRF